MSKFEFNDTIKSITAKSQFSRILMQESEQGIIICSLSDKKIIFMNETAEKKFFTDLLDNCGSLDDIFSKEEISSIMNEEKIRIEVNINSLEVISKKIEDHLIVFLRDKIDERQELRSLRELNKYLQNVYENYTDDTISITDGEGIVEFCGEACERHCGITATEIIGKSMFDLEREKYFYPSATVEALKSGKTEVVKQDTKIGTTLITVGIPIYENGRIKKVIAISRDFTKEIEIATLLIDIKQDTEINTDDDNEFGKIITCSRKIYSVMTLMKMVSKVDSTVLLTGETGSGKTLFAEYIHSKSKRAQGPFIKVNCGAISESIMESELYGYEAGSFTGANKEGKKGLFEHANGGTILLDEISEMPLRQQVKLLHVLQERSSRRVGGGTEIPFDVRIVVATNKNLEELVEKGLFREDLYYRLNVVTITIPALRERKEDIPLLIKHFMSKYNSHSGMSKEISSAAIKELCEYKWPGNVRELENMIEMLSITTKGNLIDIENLPEKVIRDPGKSSGAVSINYLAPLQTALEETKEKLIRMALKQGGNQKKAAEILGVDRSTITRKANEYGITNK